MARATFKVPEADIQQTPCGWFWELAGRRGVSAVLHSGLVLGPSDYGWLDVTATPQAMKQVRELCKERGYEEVRG